MPLYDIVVIGASAGGIEALKAVIGELPATFPAPILVVLHLLPNAPSVLSYVLRRAGRLASRCPVDGEQIEPGRIYVAPPDRHLLVEDTVMRLSHDLPDHGHRPAVDVLFRSAAHSFGPRAIGVVLSGNQRDGTAGLAMIVSLGGAGLVQDPAEARFGGMPRSAIDRVPSAQVLPAHELGRVIVQLVQGETPPPPRSGLRPGSPERALGVSEDRGETSINPPVEPPDGRDGPPRRPAGPSEART